MPGPLYLAVEGGSIDVQLDSFEQTSLYIILGISVLALLVAGYFAQQVLAAPRGTKKMIEISDAIQEGSRAYLKRQFSTLSIFVVLLTLEFPEARARSSSPVQSPSFWAPDSAHRSGSSA
jgi:K(+)-stimulated pyrophosphate-energized sodium pump